MCFVVFIISNAYIFIIIAYGWQKSDRGQVGVENSFEESNFIQANRENH